MQDSGLTAYAQALIGSTYQDDINQARATMPKVYYQKLMLSGTLKGLIVKCETWCMSKTWGLKTYRVGKTGRDVGTKDHWRIVASEWR